MPHVSIPSIERGNVRVGDILLNTNSSDHLELHKRIQVSSC